jgi:hypothetical protein
MFAGQFLAPIVAEPLIDSDSPAAVWGRISGVLLCLSLLYAVFAKKGYGETVKLVAGQTT